MITVFIHYKLDPYQLGEFEVYARRWLQIIPACGGELIGYFLPYEGTNYIGYGLIRFGSLAEYEAYRVRLKSDAGGKANFEFAHERRFILEESRTFLREVLPT